MYTRILHTIVLSLGSILAAFSVLFIALCSPAFATNIPIASTVALESPVVVEEGWVIVADEETQIYALSKTAVDPRVYGVTAKQPPVVFSTGTNTVPIITEGVALVQVVDENGPIERGDLLVTSATAGAAMRAGDGDEYVFAIALEAYSGVDGVGRIQAEIGVANAIAKRDAALAAAEAQASAEDGSDTKEKTPIVRGAIATVLVIGALFFVLYSFRSAIIQGVTSVGRNPRARIPIMTLSVASIIFALILCAVVVFVAVAILVLPL